MWFTPTNILVIALFIQSSHAYSLGAPDYACRRMTPGHGFDAVNQSPDPSGAPVKLTLNPPDGSDIVPGQTVSVSLEAQGEQNALRTREGKQVFSGKNFKFASAVEFDKCFTQIKLLISLYNRTLISVSPSNISTIWMERGKEVLKKRKNILIKSKAKRT